MSITFFGPIKLQENKKGVVTYGNRNYRKLLENRGRRNKFWLGDIFLFKQKLSGTSLEDKGEVLISIMAEVVGLNSVRYRMANFTDIDGNMVEGVICPNYRKNYQGEVDEISGNLLMNICKNFEGFNGKVKEISNTVDFYTKVIGILYPNSNIRQLRTDLVKMSMFDHFMNQRDRHSSNITFIKEQDKVVVAPIYDNGAAFMFNYGSKKISNISNEMKKSTNKENFYYSSLKANTMFGIKTKISDTIYTEKECFVDCYNNNLDEIKQYEKELAREIINNKEVRETYNEIKNLDMEYIFDKAEFEGCALLDDYKSLICDMINFKVERMEKIIEQEQTTEKEEDRYTYFKNILNFGADNER